MTRSYNFGILVYRRWVLDTYQCYGHSGDVVRAFLFVFISILNCQLGRFFLNTCRSYPFKLMFLYTWRIFLYFFTTFCTTYYVNDFWKISLLKSPVNANPRSKDFFAKFTIITNSVRSVFLDKKGKKISYILR